MTGHGNRTGIKEDQLVGPTGGRVEFEGKIVSIVDGGSGAGFLRIDTHEGPRSRIVLYGEFKDCGDGFEFVETAPRGYW